MVNDCATKQQRGTRPSVAPSRAGAKPEVTTEVDGGGELDGTGLLQCSTRTEGAFLSRALLFLFGEEAKPFGFRLPFNHPAGLRVRRTSPADGK